MSFVCFISSHSSGGMPLPIPLVLVVLRFGKCSS